jgi:hypothetical protein
MFSILTFLGRTVAGIAVLLFAWFVFDNIHDRNTEILAALIGIQYSFIFLISRRLEYFGLSAFSLFGRTVSYIRKMPYDHVLREEVGLSTRGRHLYLNVLFAALLELLCVYRLLSSLIGQGWRETSDPIHELIETPLIQAIQNGLR